MLGRLVREFEGVKVPQGVIDELDRLIVDCRSLDKTGIAARVGSYVSRYSGQDYYGALREEVLSRLGTER